MDLALEPDIYVPIMNEKGEYVDVCPSSIKNGLRCSCGSRLDHIYESKSKFKTHLNTQTHKNWLINFNNNKKNIYEDNIRLNELVKNQREIIAKMEKELIHIKNINMYLENKLFHYHNQEQTTVTDLLDINY